MKTNRKKRSLEIQHPLAPMEARSVEEIPEGGEWQYEPKWDGFRCIAFRDGAKVELQSKSLQSLTRYFPELESALSKMKCEQFALDGEIAVPTKEGFSFDALLQRIHPAASRVKRLAAETPAILIVFDLLAGEDGVSLLGSLLRDRRTRLEKFAAKCFPKDGMLRLSPMTTKLAEAKKWLSRTGATLDGIVAKRRDLEYRAGERDGMQKIKNFRSADCVVGGFRYGSKTNVVGSLLLGLYDDDGLLHHVGFTSSIAQSDRAKLTKKLEALIAPPGFTGSRQGGPSRWNNGRESEWHPLKPSLVVEVSYDHVTDGRFRHGTRLLRWRPDKRPRQCDFEQLGQKSSNLLRLLR